MSHDSQEAGAVHAHYKARYGDFISYWPHLKRRMADLTGYGEYCNNTTLEEGILAVYRAISAEQARSNQR